MTNKRTLENIEMLRSYLPYKGVSMEKSKKKSGTELKKCC